MSRPTRSGLLRMPSERFTTGGGPQSRTRFPPRARLRRRVAVVGECLELEVDVPREALELGELILRERLGGEEIERARRGIFGDRVEDREVVAERLAARRRGDDDRVLSGVRRLE